MLVISAKQESPIWNGLLQTEKAFANWYRRNISKKYQIKPVLYSLYRDRNNYLIKVKLASINTFDQTIIENLKKEVQGINYVQEGNTYHLIIEILVPLNAVRKELKTVSYSALRRYLEAYCSLPLKLKSQPISVAPMEVPEEWQKDFLCETVDNLYMWVPYMDNHEFYDKEEDNFWESPENERKWEHRYSIVFCSALHQILEYYTDSPVPKRAVIELTGISRSLDYESLLAFFKNPPYDKLRKIFLLIGFDAWPSEVFNKKEQAEALLAKADAVLETHSHAPYNAMIAKGVALIILRWKDKLEVLEQKVKEMKQKAAEAVKTTKMCPPLPHFRKDFKLLPHQAAVLGSLVNQNNALLGVEMGGGKTLISIYDALVSVAQGKANRPCIVMPNNLLYQFKNEIAKFTAGSVNAIIVNSRTARRYGMDKLKELIITAPKNTIVLCSYEWLSHGEVRKASGSHIVSVYDRAAWLVGECKVDMVTLDEAHYIKNSTSKRSEATLLLRHAKIKRAMSGTIVPNKLVDLVVPTSFVKPFIFRGQQEFESKYTIKSARGNVRGYKQGAPQEIKDLLEKNNAIFMSRAAWVYLLPKRRIKVHAVEMPEELKAEYLRILQDTLSEVEKMAASNPDIKAALEGLEDLSKFPALLQKLTALDKFLSCPACVSELVQMLPPEKQVSPKVKKINEILANHFANPKSGKVIIMCRYKATARHIIDNLQMKDEALYFDADHSKNLIQFKNNPKYKVLVAVDAALKHGWNITEATRIIRVDLNYSWGDEDQTFGRIFRPGQKLDVQMDIIVTNGGFDVAKFLNLVTKYVVNAYVTTDIADKFSLDEKYLHLIPLNKENIMTMSSANLAMDYAQVLDKMLELEREIGLKKYAALYGTEYVDPPRAKPLSLKKIAVPYIKHVDTSIDWYIGYEKPKFDFSLIGGTKEIEKVKEETVAVEEAKKEKRDVWLKAKVTKANKKLKLAEGDILIVKPQKDGSYLAVRPGGKLTFVIPKTTARQSLQIIGPADTEPGKDIAVGFDANGYIWVKFTGKRVTGPQATYARKGMRKLVRGWMKVAATLVMASKKVPINNLQPLLKNLKKVSSRFTKVEITAAKAKALNVYIFPRPDIGKNVWEIFIPKRSQKLLGLRFQSVDNISLVRIKQLSDVPDNLQPIAKKLRAVLKKRKREE